MIELFVSADAPVVHPTPDHAAEPWRASTDAGYRTGWIYLEDQTGLMLGAIFQREDADRIVACINACARIATSTLESGVLGDLLGAIGDILAAGTSDGDEFTCSYEDVNRLSAAFQRLRADQRGSDASS